jgi:hypothetical protein
MSEMSMMGSGIYSTEVTLEVVCAEYGCDDCEPNTECKGIWEQDFVTDDWGNIDDRVTCPDCKHQFNFRKESE